QQPRGQIAGAGPAGICLYRPFQCGQVVAYQRPYRTPEPGQDITDTWKDAAYQPLSDQWGVVHCGPARLWLCQSFKNKPYFLGKTYQALLADAGKSAMCFRIG